MKNKICIIRSFSSGVHFGEVAEMLHTPHGLSVVLFNSRRIHYWEGACSLSQVAIDGIKTGRVAVELPEIMIQTVSEVIPMSEKAIENLKNIEVWKF